LNNGLESLCDEVLPPEFRIDSVDGEPSSGCKFAIRPTIRNNEKFNRDDVIRMVADKITALGNGKHSVDLKGYDKLVLVDVYRNVVGMSVVGNEFERLRRFNLAELHATHLGEVDSVKASGATQG
jgi:tRNA acetyltransferase TAN1